MKKIAVLTSGGDAPGMNAALRAVVRTATYYGMEVYGAKRGFDGLIQGDIYKMKSYSVSNIISLGGTILKTARSVDFHAQEGRDKAYEQLQSRGIEGLIVIGGDGSMMASDRFSKAYDFPIIGIPGTINNDLYGTDFTIGFDTAVNTALDAIDKIRDTANSHDRIFFVEVMGRDAGYIAIQTGIGGGAELVMVPETETSIQDVISTLQAGWDRAKSASIVVTAEGNAEGSAIDIAQKVKSHINNKDIKITTLGHIQRGGSPSAFDRILSSRLGLNAVEALRSGKKGVMIGIIKDEVVYTPLDIAVNTPKPLNDELVRMVEILNS
ncbi:MULTISPECIES: 6-phosphofructokinase [Persicobacter]|uniref:ATP-dependent 6-phosphofructokinase n=1 Tax=Persicobacter diffluens TaxID=981 RepID=A0AAN5AIY7_9BACT|nr:6-phosphofructokinase [Persicobacter sp. CCB-QB2]GJM60357.1 ATP-dependent 6-phosphofructokinase [Persicobacter diffluens]